MKEVLRTILEAKAEFEAAHKTLSVGIVLFCNSSDDPLGSFGVPLALLYLILILDFASRP